MAQVIARALCKPLRLRCASAAEMTTALDGCEVLAGRRRFQVFLSHRAGCEPDAAIARELSRQLRGRVGTDGEGLSVWVEEAPAAGAGWSTAFAQRLSNSDVFVPVVSARALAPLLLHGGGGAAGDDDGPSSHKTASCFTRRALLTPRLSPVSPSNRLYRCGQSTYT